MRVERRELSAARPLSIALHYPDVAARERIRHARRHKIPHLHPPRADGVPQHHAGSRSGRAHGHDGPVGRGLLAYGQSGSWPLTGAVPGQVNTLLVILMDNAMWEKYVTDLAFYRDGVMVGG